MLYNKKQVIFKDFLVLLSWFMNNYIGYLKENGTSLHKIHTLDSPKNCSACMLNPHNLTKSHKFSDMGRSASLMLFLSVCHHKAHRDNGCPQNSLLQTWKQFQPPGKTSHAVCKPRHSLSSSVHPVLNYYYTLWHMDSTVIYNVYASCTEPCSLRHTALCNRQTGRGSERGREFISFLLYTSYFRFFFLLCLLNS